MTIKDIFTVNTFEDHVLSETDVIALRNVIELAKERLWLADSYPKRPTPSFDFEEKMSDDEIETSSKSISSVQSIILRITR